MDGDAAEDVLGVGNMGDAVIVGGAPCTTCHRIPADPPENVKVTRRGHIPGPGAGGHGHDLQEMLPVVHCHLLRGETHAHLDIRPRGDGVLQRRMGPGPAGGDAAQVHDHAHPAIGRPEIPGLDAIAVFLPPDDLHRLFGAQAPPHGCNGNGDREPERKRLVHPEGRTGGRSEIGRFGGRAGGAGGPYRRTREGQEDEAERPGPNP